ncbi:MAG: PAS domain S-box protein [Verrucomicrobiota bacterium]|nr:PAS domain S-box protein [Verrucomicrobiota bacterium]
MGIIRDISERKQLEKAQEAAKADRLFREVADHAPVLIWVSDANGPLYYFNKCWCEFTGRTLEEIADNQWLADLHPDDQKHTYTNYVASFEARLPFQTEYRLKRHDGVYRNILMKATPIIPNPGEFNGFIGTGTDITEIRELEKYREEHTAFIRRILNSLLGSVIVLDESLRVRVANDVGSLS